MHLFTYEKLLLMEIGLTRGFAHAAMTGFSQGHDPPARALPPNTLARRIRRLEWDGPYTVKWFLLAPANWFMSDRTPSGTRIRSYSLLTSRVPRVQCRNLHVIQIITWDRK